MMCPECDGKSKVIDSRVVELNVFRVRKCSGCGLKFYTEEISIDQEEARAYMSALKRVQRAKRMVSG